ncbi:MULTISPECIES: hypothetical protein [unclassified Bradyrhizobium]|nr:MULTISPECIES: hypothetical protein [unclassified Bradyrhizobium]
MRTWQIEVRCIDLLQQTIGRVAARGDPGHYGELDGTIGAAQVVG